MLRSTVVRVAGSDSYPPTLSCGSQLPTSVRVPLAAAPSAKCLHGSTSQLLDPVSPPSIEDEMRILRILVPVSDAESRRTDRNQS